MRIISTICFFLFFSFGSFGQSMPATSSFETALQDMMGCGIVQVQPSQDKKPDTAIKIRIHCCRTITTSDEPLIVVDGIPVKGNQLADLKPENIDSIWILKNAAALAIYGSEGINGVIIITTKKSIQRKLTIKDFLDGAPIPGATVSFISSNKKDTLHFVANDSGVVIINKLKPSSDYEITVSAIGYSLIRQDYKNRYEYIHKEILMNRQITSCAEVIITGTNCPRRTVCYAFSRVTREKYIEETDVSLLKLYPNPVRPGSFFNLEFPNNNNSDKILRVLSIDGRIVMEKQFKSDKDNNFFQPQSDARWTPGTYIVQVIYENGQVSASGKLVIQ